jgi:hypothetical protein
MNEYLEEVLARERILEARAMAARHALVRSLAPARRPMRVALGYALIRVGRWVAGRELTRGHAERVTA